MPRAADTTVPRVAFIVGPGSVVPPEAFAIREAGNAIIVAEPDTSDAPFEDLPLGEGYALRVRTAALVWPHSNVPDLVTAVGPPAVVSARAWLNGGKRHTATKHAPPPAAVAVATTAKDDSYPSWSRRILAGYRLWNAIELFYPYPDLARGWRESLPRLITELERATNGREYADVVIRAASRLADPHVRVSGKAADDILGAAGPPIGVTPIDGLTVVTRKHDVGAEALAIGDVVVAVDGTPIADRIAGLAPYVPATTVAHRTLRLHRLALFGSGGSIAQLTVRDVTGRTRIVNVSRGILSPSGLRQRDGDVVKWFPGGIAYVDLDRLKKHEVDDTMDRVMPAHGLILDMRGYPRETLWAIAARLNVKGAATGALFRYRRVGAVLDGTDDSATFRQAIRKTDKPLYRGRVVVLIDARALSQSEHACLFFSAAAPVTFIGEPTGGITGGVKHVTLPGGLSVSFTGIEVRHADGRVLAGTGIVPDVHVRHTLTGVRAGRDEVLERALEYLGGKK